MAKPSERSLDLAEVALDSAVRACVPIGSGSDDSDMSKLAREYQTAVDEISALRKELYGVSKRIRLELTPAQCRMVNTALALLEADDHDPDFRHDVLARTRDAVWDALDTKKKKEGK